MRGKWRVYNSGYCRYVRTIIHWVSALIIECSAPATRRAYCLSSNYTLIDSDCARIVNTSELGKPILLISPGEFTEMSFAYMDFRCQGCFPLNKIWSSVSIGICHEIITKIIKHITVSIYKFNVYYLELQKITGFMTLCA